MNYVLYNDLLKVSISDYGAEIRSIQSQKTNVEYLWQGSDVYWEDRATVIFPICGRLYQGKYTYLGKEYEMIIHGFAKVSTFTVVEHTPEKVVMLLTANDFTRAQYPFEFKLKMIYTLKGNQIKQTFMVENTDNKTLIFTCGGHPGFNVPWKDGEQYEDYYLEFENDKPQYNIFFNQDGLFNGRKELQPMVDGKIIPLSHDLFDNDALFLQDGAKKVSLKSKKNNTVISVEYQDMTRVGFWKDEKTTAPFLCIEPWAGIPASAGVTDDLETKAEMTHLAPKGICEKSFTITVEE